MSSYPSHNKISDSCAIVSMFKDVSELEFSTYKSSSSDVAELVAHRANENCLGEGSIKLETYLLKNCVCVKELNTTLLSVGYICDYEIFVIFTKKDAVFLNQQTVDAG